VLVAKEGERYIAKLADFGMTYSDDHKAPVVATTTTTDSKPPARASAQRQREEEENDLAIVQQQERVDPYGTWEYMSPECWKRKHGKPNFASDVFSFGVMMWEMLARTRICAHLLDEDNPAHLYNEAGKDALNPKLVPALFIKGERPRYTGLQQNVRDQCGHVYYRLMQACWTAKISERPPIAQVVKALELARSYVANEHTEDEIGAIEAEAAQAKADKAAEAETEQPEAEIITYDIFLTNLGLQGKKDELAEYLSTPGAELTELLQMDTDELDSDILEDDDLGFDEPTREKFRTALRNLSGKGQREQHEPTFDDFLSKLGLQDRKEDLAEYLSDPGKELTELKQMDDADLSEDILDDPSLGLDEETKAKFRAELHALKQPQAAAEQQEAKSEFHPDLVAAAAIAAAEREAKWPKWHTLQQMLPGLRGLDGGRGTDDSTELEALRQLVDKQAREIEQLHAEKAAEAVASAAAAPTEGIPPGQTSTSGS
jgi:serine/threonine protein kinase